MIVEKEVSVEIDLYDYIDDFEKEFGVDIGNYHAIQEYVKEMFEEIYLRNNLSAKTYKEVYEDLERILR